MSAAARPDVSQNNIRVSYIWKYIYLAAERAPETLSAVSCSMLMAAQQVVWCTFGLSLSFIACSAPHKNTNNKTARWLLRRNSLPVGCALLSALLLLYN